MQKTTPPSMLYRGGIADLPLLRKLVIRQKSQELSFWEVMDSFVLVAYASLVDMNFVDNELFPFRVTVLCIRSSVKMISGKSMQLQGNLMYTISANCLRKLSSFPRVFSTLIVSPS